MHSIANNGPKHIYYVIDSPNAGPRSTRDLVACVAQQAKHVDQDAQVQRCDWSTALHNLRQESPADTVVLTAPGGHAAHMLDELRAPQRTAIRQAVGDGANYLGICAGAILGSRTLHASLPRAGDIATTAVPMLGLLAGATATCPAFLDAIDAPFSYASVRNVGVTMDGKTYTPGWIHGPKFAVKGQARVLATYDGLTADGAAVVRELGYSSQVILSGVHPEFGGPSETPEQADSREAFMRALLIYFT